MVKNLPANAGDLRDLRFKRFKILDLILGWEDPLEEGMVTHSSNLVCRILWTEEPGWLQSIGL